MSTSFFQVCQLFFLTVACSMAYGPPHLPDEDDAFPAPVGNQPGFGSELINDYDGDDDRHHEVGHSASHGPSYGGSQLQGGTFWWQESHPFDKPAGHNGVEVSDAATIKPPVLGPGYRPPSSGKPFQKPPGHQGLEPGNKPSFVPPGHGGIPPGQAHRPSWAQGNRPGTGIFQKPPGHPGVERPSSHHRPQEHSPAQSFGQGSRPGGAPSFQAPYGGGFSQDGSLFGPGGGAVGPGVPLSTDAHVKPSSGGSYDGGFFTLNPTKPSLPTKPNYEPKTTTVAITPRPKPIYEKCSAGYACTSFYLCQEGKIIQNGEGLIDTRSRPSNDELQQRGKVCGQFHVCCQIPNEPEPQPATVEEEEHQQPASSIYGAAVSPAAMEIIHAPSGTLAGSHGPKPDENPYGIAGPISELRPPQKYPNRLPQYEYRPPSGAYAPPFSGEQSNSVYHQPGPDGILQTPHPGCAAALKCVPLEYCDLNGVMVDKPVKLSSIKDIHRVPLMECLNPDTALIGFCCRDPNYEDPWPDMQAGGQVMKKPTKLVAQSAPNNQHHTNEPTWIQQRPRPPAQSPLFVEHQGAAYGFVTPQTDVKPVKPGRPSPKPQQTTSRPIYPTTEAPNRRPPQQQTTKYTPFVEHQGAAYGFVTPQAEVKPAKPGRPSPKPQQTTSRPIYPTTEAPSRRPPQQQTTKHTPFVEHQGAAYGFVTPQAELKPAKPGHPSPKPQQTTSRPIYPTTEAPSRRPQQQPTTKHPPFVEHQAAAYGFVTGQQQAGIKPSPSPQPVPVDTYQPEPISSCSHGYDCVDKLICNGNGEINKNGAGLIDARILEHRCHRDGNQVGICCKIPTSDRYPKPAEIPVPDGHEIVLSGPQPGSYDRNPHLVKPGFGEPDSSPAPATSSCPTGKRCVFPHQCQQEFQTGKAGSSQLRPEHFRIGQQLECIMERENAYAYGICCDTAQAPSPGIDSHYQPSTEEQQHQGNVIDDETCGLIKVPYLPADQRPDQGGSESLFGELPWQAIIFFRNKTFQCGATILTREFILTAAHCVDGLRPDEIRIRVGEWEVGKETELKPFQDLDIDQIRIHPDFEDGPLYHDIAMLKLKSPIQFDDHIQPICLPTNRNEAEKFINHYCIASGWGKDAHDGGKYQSKLKKIELPIISKDQCQNDLRNTRLGKYFKLHGSFICAGGDGHKDVCKGDGGGPLACRKSSGQYVLAGITSWGISCNEPGVPGAYTNVPFELDWIQEQLRHPNRDSTPPRPRPRPRPQATRPGEDGRDRPVVEGHRGPEFVGVGYGR